MVDTNVKTVRKNLNNLVEKGFLYRRTNPVYKFDRTYQYRVNLRAIVDGVNNLGHYLEGFEQFSHSINNVTTYYLFDKQKGHYLGSFSDSPESQIVSFESDNLVNRDVDMTSISGKNVISNNREYIKNYN